VFGQEHDGESYATNLDLTGRFNLGVSKPINGKAFIFKTKLPYGTNCISWEADVITGRKRPGEEEPASQRLKHRWAVSPETMTASVHG